VLIGVNICAPIVSRTPSRSVSTIFFENVHTTFLDGTKKTANDEVIDIDDVDPSKDFIEKNVRITPRAGTALDKLGLEQISYPGDLTKEFRHNIKYKDGRSIEKSVIPHSVNQQLTLKDFQGNVLQTTVIDLNEDKTYSVNPVDDSRSDYNAGGSYVTTWRPKPDGSQQFYDSKQQKIFVRNANGNIIPPNE
jgi:hypothetical protein